MESASKQVGGGAAGGSEGRKRAALGKGLESLLGPRRTPGNGLTGVAGAGSGEAGGVVAGLAAAAAPLETGGRPLEIALDRIERNPFQTRTHFDEKKLQELAVSIKASGVHQPVVVRELPGGTYQLIAGERRWRASKLAGLATVPAIVRQVSDELALEMTIVENLQREDLNPMEQARAFNRLGHEFRMTQEQMAERTGKDRATITNFMRLLRLPKMVQGLIEAGELTMGHGRALLALETVEQMEGSAQFMVAGAMSVRNAELFVQDQLNPEMKKKRLDAKAAAAEKTQDPNVREAQDRLQRALGLRVRIEDKKGKGRVIIDYSGVDDFDAILGALGGEG